MTATSKKIQFLKSFEIITNDGKSHFVSAFSKNNVKAYWRSSPIKKIIERTDIDPQTNTSIEMVIVVDKSNYEVYEFIGGHLGICKTGKSSECVYGGNSANLDDYNEDYIREVYENWNGELHYSGATYGYLIETN